jgi:hypothetical protein
MMTYLELFLVNLPAFLLGLALVELCWPKAGPADAWLRLALATGVGWGIVSCLFFFWSLIFSPFQPGFIWLVGLLALLLGGMALWRGKNQWREAFFVRQWKFSSQKGVMILSLVVLSLFLAIVLWQQADAKPNGNFDAYAIWNLRARFIFLSSPDSWKAAFSPDFDNTMHADYPLLWPLIILQGYFSQGRVLTQAGVFQTVIFGVSTAMLMVAALFKIRDGLQAIFGGALLLGMPWFITYNAFQQSDGPLTYYYLMFIVLMVFYQTEPRPGLLWLAGLSAGLTVWTKNDGVMFLFAALIVMVAAYLPRSRRAFLRSTAYFGLGLLLPMVTVLVFKLTLAPPNDLFIDRNLTMLLENVFIPSRWLTILVALGNMLPDIGGWSPVVILGLVIYLLLAGRVGGQPGGKLFFIIGITLIGYFGIYLITPYSLEWHLRYSLDRLLFHLLVPTLFLLLVHFHTPRELVDILKAAFPWTIISNKSA